MKKEWEQERRKEKYARGPKVIGETLKEASGPTQKKKKKKKYRKMLFVVFKFFLFFYIEII